MEKKNSKTYWLVFVGVALIIAIIIFCVWLPYKNKTKAPESNLNGNTNSTNQNDNINDKTNSKPSTVSPEQSTFNQATEAYKSKDFLKAESDLVAILSSDKNNLEAMMLLANTYRDTNRLAKAKEIYSNVIGLDPKKVQAYLNLSQVLLQENNVSGAREILDKGLVNNPNNPDITDSIALLSVTPSNDDI